MKKDENLIQKIKELEEEKERLLTAHPELHRLQFELEERLLAAGDDPELRSKIAHDMMMNHLETKLVPALGVLKKLMKELKKEIQDESPRLRLIHSKDQ